MPDLCGEDGTLPHPADEAQRPPKMEVRSTGESEALLTPIRARSPGSWLPVFCASSFTPFSRRPPSGSGTEPGRQESGYTLTWKVIDVSEVNSSAVLTPEVPVDWPSR